MENFKEYLTESRGLGALGTGIKGKKIEPLLWHDFIDQFEDEILSSTGYDDKLSIKAVKELRKKLGKVMTDHAKKYEYTLINYK